jgi:hypothetical protein
MDATSIPELPNEENKESVLLDITEDILNDDEDQNQYFE